MRPQARTQCRPLRRTELKPEVPTPRSHREQNHRWDSTLVLGMFRRGLGRQAHRTYITNLTVPWYYRPPSSSTGTFNRRFIHRSRLAQPDREIDKMKDASVADSRLFIVRFPRNSSWKQGHLYKTFIGLDEAPVGHALPTRLSAAPFDLSAWYSRRWIVCGGLDRDSCRSYSLNIFVKGYKHNVYNRNNTTGPFSNLSCASNPRVPEAGSIRRSSLGTASGSSEGGDSPGDHNRACSSLRFGHNRILCTEQSGKGQRFHHHRFIRLGDRR